MITLNPRAKDATTTSQTSDKFRDLSRVNLIAPQIGKKQHRLR
jgi:hypothetical protein